MIRFFFRYPDNAAEWRTGEIDCFPRFPQMAPERHDLHEASRPDAQRRAILGMPARPHRIPQNPDRGCSTIVIFRIILFVMASKTHGAAAVGRAQEGDIAWVMHGMAGGAFHFPAKQLYVRPTF